MTARGLFQERVVMDARKNWQTIRLLIDWTVMVYVLVPFLMYTGFVYVLLWQGKIEWIGHFKVVWVLMFFLLFRNDRLVVWIEQSDTLLFSAKRFIRQIKHYSLQYCTLHLVLKYGFCLLLFAPIFHEQGWSAVDTLALWLSLILIAWLHMWIRYQQVIRDHHWMKQLLMELFIFGCVYSLFTDMVFLRVLMGSGLVAYAMWIGEGWLSRQSYLGREVEWSERVRSSLQRTVLKGAGALRQKHSIHF